MAVVDDGQVVWPVPAVHWNTMTGVKRMDGGMDGRVGGWREGWMEGGRDGGMDGWVDGGMGLDGGRDGWLEDGGKEAWMEGGRDGGMGGWRGGLGNEMGIKGTHVQCSDSPSSDSEHRPPEMIHWRTGHLSGT